MTNVKIDRNVAELRKLDELGEETLKSPKLMNLVINGATLMSVNKDTLRGIIRVILTGAAAEITAKDQKISILEKALESACNDIADEQCPNEFDLYTCEKCPDCPHDRELHTDSERDMHCWFDYYIQKVQGESHD